MGVFSIKAYVSLTVSKILRAGTKVGFSDLLIGFGPVSKHEISYARDNSVIFS